MPRHMPADKDLPPTAIQRSLVRHKSAARFGIVAFAFLALSYSIWTSIDGEANGGIWLVTVGAVVSRTVIV